MSQECEKPGCSFVAEHVDDARREHHHRGKSSECLLDKNVILCNLGIVPGQTILDAGCGNGYMAKEFSRLLDNTGKVFALDVDETAIAAIREETEGTNIVAMLGDITSLTQLPSSAMDLVYLSTVFHGFSSAEIKGCATEVDRLLKPHGRLAIVEIVKRPTPFGPPLSVRFSAEELIQALPLVPQATVDVGEHFYMQVFTKRNHS